ncbi:unnamed protein product [Ophioblennius macclurei]
MICWTLFLLVAIGCASGRPPLPPLPVKDGCFQVTPEVEVFRVEGEAVILHFPFFSRALAVRSIAPPAAAYLIRRETATTATTTMTSQETAATSGGGGGRVQQQSQQLWLLPARVSDSGEYTCTYRNETFCIRGSVTLHMVASSSTNVDLLSYPVSAAPGEALSLSCPSLSVFNRTDGRVQWFKDSSSTALNGDGGSGGATTNKDRLTIPAIRTWHAGVYTCRLRVSIDRQQFTVSRIILLDVLGSDSETTTVTPTEPSVTWQPEPPSTQTPPMHPPLIVSPLNGSVFESSHGSGLEMSCVVLTDCRQADSTEVTWLVNGQSLEASYLDGKALHGWRRVTPWADACRVELRLLVRLITEEDHDTEVKCVAQNGAGMQEVVTRLRLEDSTSTWIVVGAVAASCFLAVVSIFLYVLFKPERKKRRMDYILARQNSTM